jgi:predicted molibdopterin-dependent oxidoreductase YjgC
MQSQCKGAIQFNHDLNRWNIGSTIDTSDMLTESRGNDGIFRAACLIIIGCITTELHAPVSPSLLRSSTRLENQDIITLSSVEIIGE